MQQGRQAGGFGGGFTNPAQNNNAQQPGEINPQTSTGTGISNVSQSTQTAVGLINNILMSPRQPPTGMATAGQSQTGGPGIAGVASKFEADSIKIYNTRQKYNEWEFIYDPKMDTRGAKTMNAQQAGGVQPGNNTGSFGNGQSAFGNNATGNQSGPGNGSSFGSGSSFGNNSGSSFGNNSGSSFGNNSGSSFGNNSGGFGNSGSNNSSGFGNNSGGFGSSGTQPTTNKR
jgi:hypothetical protein